MRSTGPRGENTVLAQQQNLIERINDFVGLVGVGKSLK